MKNSQTPYPLPLPITTHQRLAFIDALRGIAVLLMIAQHVSLWVCEKPRGSLFVLMTGALGGFSAPIFVILSGVGATLLSKRMNRPDLLLVRRGGMIIGFGYAMNWLTPHWLSPGSWYILHLIGAALITVPLLRRLSDTGLILLLFIVLLVTGMLQNHLDTPFRLFNRHMAAPVGLKEAVRYALVEGFFPIFPWITFFIAGILTGRWMKNNRLDKARRLAVWFFLIVTILAVTYSIGPDFSRSEPLVRYFRLQLSFYSALTPLSLFLMAVSILLIIGFFRLDQKHGFGQSHILVCLGRVSLTFLIAHVSIIRESAFYFGYWKTLSEIGTLFTTLAILVFFAWIAKVWQRHHYKFGFEWLLRRASDRPWKKIA
jgi:uncharacterized membrane protein